MQLSEATILIVEDEEIIREIMAEWLARVARRVLTAGNGAEGLEMLDQNRVDAVLSDVRMPVMDGVTFLKTLNKRAGPRPAILLITGFADLQPRQAFDLGAETIMEKPMERRDVIAALQQSLTDRDDLWRNPLEGEPHSCIRETFGGLEEAIREGEIAFGHKGFCIQSAAGLREGPVGLHLEFKDEGKVLRGHGMVRWADPVQQEVGVELVYLDPECRGWVTEIAERNGRVCIPGSLKTITASSEEALAKFPVKGALAQNGNP